MRSLFVIFIIFVQLSIAGNKSQSFGTGSPSMPMKQIKKTVIQNNLIKQGTHYVPVSSGTGIESKTTNASDPQVKTYPIPFGSTDNSIELSVENASTTEPVIVTVTPQHTPAWLHISPEKIATRTIKPGGGDSATFSFSIDNTAPVKQAQEIKFVLSSKSGETWTKKMNITVEAPTFFKLCQNYPNPFNPATTISYQLPEDIKVSLIVYNVIGQEVATLVDEVQNAGYKQVVFNVNNISSGVYFYRLRAGSFTEIKKMLVLK